MVRFTQFLTEASRLHGRFADNWPAYEIRTWEDFDHHLMNSKMHDLRGMIVDGKLVVWDSYKHTHAQFCREFGYPDQHSNNHLTFMTGLSYGQLVLKIFCRNWKELCEHNKYLQPMVTDWSNNHQMHVEYR